MGRATSFHRVSIYGSLPPDPHIHGLSSANMSLFGPGLLSTQGKYHFIYLRIPDLVAPSQTCSRRRTTPQTAQNAQPCVLGYSSSRHAANLPGHSRPGKPPRVTFFCLAYPKYTAT